MVVNQGLLFNETLSCDVAWLLLMNLGDKRVVCNIVPGQGYILPRLMVNSSWAQWYSQSLGNSSLCGTDESD